MRLPFVFTVIMVSGMILAFALLSSQVEKSYATIVTVDISASVPPCTSDPTHLDCAASDNGATLTGFDPPFDSDFDLDCEINSEDIIGTNFMGITDVPASASCAIDFRSPELSDSDWDSRVFCMPVDPFTSGINNLNGCSGTLPFNH